jgi:hypothetical protein
VCTIFLLYQFVKDFPVVLSENRDASLLKYMELAKVNPGALADRPPKVFFPASARGTQPTTEVPFVGPFDVTNVTWIGVNQHRVALALSNGYAPGEDARSDQIETSRGTLAVEVLHSAPTASAAVEHLKRALETGDYKSVNFLVADADGAWIIQFWGKAPKVIALPAGVHVFGNYYFPKPLLDEDDAAAMKWLETDTRTRVNRANLLFTQIPFFTRPPVGKVDALAGLRSIITDHEGDPIRAMSICRHAPAVDAQSRRTLSNTTIFLHASGLDKSEIYYSPGNPCEHHWKSYSHLLQPECFESCYMESPKPENEERVSRSRGAGRKPLFGKFPLDR